MSPNYFPESALGIYITPQQLRQFKNMYPDCVSDAYRAAVGELTANIGNIFDMAAMVAQTIIKLKGGVVSLEEPAPYRTDSQNANAEVITSRYKYLG